MSSSTATDSETLPRSSRKVPTIIRWLNPLAVRLIERFAVGRHNGVLYHQGRRSGREYATPLCMVKTPEGYIVPVAFGPNTDWLKNLEATPASRVVYERKTYMTIAEVIDHDQAINYCGGRPGCQCWESGIEQFVLLRPVPDTGGTG